MWIKKILLIFALSFMSYSAISVDSINFPIPANLKNNVQFWTMIYTDVSLKEGLLHDRDNPLLIYKKIHVGALWGKPLDKFVNQHRIRIARSISIIKRQHRSTWGPEEQRIAALLDKFPAAVLDSAEDRIRFQLGQRERFKDGLERSTVYLDTIRSIMCNHGLPEYLAFLPHVESSYNYKAYSRVGAAGLWQFMPTTGKDYLRIDYSIDERRDPILSTIAAAKLLKKNYKKLKAWPLAITAYNYGLNGMLRAVNTIGTRDIGIIIDKHDSPIFRFASRNFYSCFLAASMIAANPDKYFDNIRVSPPQRFTDLVLESHMSPSDICKFLNIGEKEFASLNPSIRDIVYKYKKPIPRGYTIRIGGEKSIDELRTIASRHSPKKQPEIKGEDYYIVKKGDNLSSIAKALRV